MDLSLAYKEGRRRIKAGRQVVFLSGFLLVMLMGGIKNKTFAASESPAGDRTPRIIGGKETDREWPWMAALVLSEEGSGEVEVEAERVELDRDAGEILFIGGVLLRHGTVELRCGRLRARIDESGRLADIVATGEVRVRARGHRASAGTARYQPATGRITLSGGPMVQGESGVLRGRSIVIDIGTGRVTIEEAHGVFRVGS